MRLADSHCHLDDGQFTGDRQSVISQARAAGVEYMLAIGTGDGPPDLEAAVRLAAQYSFLFATAGVHPNDTPKIGSDTFNDLARLLGHPKIKAVGEMGLDYHWGTPKDAQIPAFERQLALAREAKLPVVIHTRDAWDDTLDILRSSWAGNGLACVMHCFTGTPEQAQQCLDLGFHLAFGGVATFPKSAMIREAARMIPADRLLLETDCPYLAPAPFRGKRNQPAYIAYIAQAVADARGVPVEELAETTTRNFIEVFRIEEKHAQ